MISQDMYSVKPVQLTLHPPSQSTELVSVVIPCLNEEKYIEGVLENLIRQYDVNCLEIIVVDGLSQDRTREIVWNFIRRNPDVKIRLVDNSFRNIPSALNIGIREAQGNFIVRMDGHSIPSPNYIRRCVELLSDSDFSVVGMPCRIHPSSDTLTAQAIALAVSHPFGIGDAQYRIPATPSQLVDTVPFGSFRKTLWQELGGFNENLLSNEDYEFNYRVRQRGGLIFLDSTGHCTYFSRPTVWELVKQYFRYGTWKAQMVKKHPHSIRWRHLVAPIFVGMVFTLTVISFWALSAFYVLLSVLSLYALMALLFAFQLSNKKGDLRLLPATVLTFFSIHSSWGSGFLLGLVRSPQ